MALPSKTIELIEQIAENLDIWAKGWGKRLLKNRPRNLRQFRQSILAEFGNTNLPKVGFKIEFNSGLNKALEGFGSVLERLYQHMPNMAPIVQKKHKRFVTEAKSTCQLPIGDQIWFKKFNNSRDIAIDLAKTLRHIAEMAREDLSIIKPQEITEDNLTKRQMLAYQCYEYAISQNPNLAEANDNEIYNWLKINGLPGDGSYTLPSCETWKRYLRYGRKAHGTQKNTPRKGRAGRSIVKASQIEYTSNQQPD